MAVILYCPGGSPIWMYSPFLLVLTLNLRPMPSVASMVIWAFSTGWFFASTTLPFTCPVWA